MPNLSDLGYNRFIQRDNRNLDNTDTGSSMFADINNTQGNQNTVGGVPPSQGAPAANGIQPGSQPIQSTIIQSSPSDNRIEINPNDTFKAYNAGQVVVLIDKNGITAASTGTDTLNVSNTFNYQGEPQPVHYIGTVDITGAGTDLPTGWTSTLFGTGTYIITHNLNTVDYKITCSPVTGHYRMKVAAINLNSVIIDWQESAYSAGLYTGEVGVNTTFQFVLFKKP
jgi:hypothetical protein